MKTIKELKDSGDYLDEHNNGYYWALKDVLKLIDEINNEVHIHRLMELKKRIEG